LGRVVEPMFSACETVLLELIIMRSMFVKWLYRPIDRGYKTVNVRKTRGTNKCEKTHKLPERFVKPHDTHRSCNS